MAKNNFVMLKIGIPVIVIIVGVAGSFVWGQADTRAVDIKADGIKEHLDTMKVEGCKPAVKNKLDIALVQKDIATIQKTQTEMRTEQQTAFKEILKRLPK